ncbi:MAG: TldD/PmbA family protein [Proteobacteria bacterium]|nr:TldD/PmbA family protein [Pseudomonadota bacterium]
MSTPQDPLNLLTDLLAKATQAGAESADAVYVDSVSLSVSQRLGNPEKLERSESSDIGLRVFVGHQQAIVSSSDMTAEALEEIVTRAVAMARSVPEDPYCGLADANQIATDIPSLDICDDSEPSAETLVAWANEAEEAARAVPGVTNSEGAEAGWGRAEVAVAATNGFAQTYAGSHFSLAASVLAGEGTAMERDYDYSGAVYGSDLWAPAEIGRSAGEKAVKRLSPRKVETSQVPVIYDPRVSRSMLSHLSSAINGSSIARKTSFLMDKMGQQIFASGITVVDDPHRSRGLRSKPFDGEGIANKRREVIQDGKLTTWIMDLRSSRQLGLETTGHASRGTGSPPSPAVTNLYLAAGEASPEELIAEIKQGFYITELIGMGINGLTGDYSRGASGYWIENGALAYPVSEVTVAGNLKDMFREMVPANDLDFRYGVDAPTLRIDGMTVAGL